jgi:N-methylhydantoinase A
MQSAGGYMTAEEAESYPVRTLASGPVGGVIGANLLGRMLGVRDIITADVGGTSFDTSLILRNKYDKELRAWFGRFITGLPRITVESVGTGGGTIFWVDDIGILRFGPRSAGAWPGPACYGRGGTEPTLTDACLLLGLLNPKFFLGGKIVLDENLAENAVKSVAERLGWGIVEASAAVYKLLVASASEAVRTVSVGKGHDPRGFAMIAYGGASPLFAAEICKEMKIEKMIIPRSCSVFSALGLICSDYLREHVRSYNYRKGMDITPVNKIYEDLTKRTIEDLEAAGIEKQNQIVIREADVRYVGQFFELAIQVENKILTIEDLEEKLYRDFEKEYEKTYGRETVWTGSPIETINLRVRGVGYREPPKLKEFPWVSKDAASAIKTERKVYIPGLMDWEIMPIYDYAKLEHGMILDGYALIEHTDTTTFIPESAKVEVDRYKNLVLKVHVEG